MKKTWQISLIILIFATCLFLWLKHERQSAKNEEKIENLKQENEGQKQVIKIIDVQKKLVSKTLVNNDVVARSQWLQRIFEEREASN